MPTLRLFRDKDYKGGEVPVTGNTPSLVGLGFNDVISSLQVEGGTWTLYQDINFRGFSVTVSASAHGGQNNDGRYPNPDWLGGRNDTFSSIRKNSDIG